MSGEKVDAAEISEYPRNAWERAKMRRYFLRLGEFRYEKRRKRFVEHLRRLHGVARSAELLKAHRELQRKRELLGSAKSDESSLPRCSREFVEWRDARRHVKFCSSAPRPRSHVEAARALERMLDELRKLAQRASPEEIAALRAIAVRAAEQHLTVAKFLREIVDGAGQQHRPRPELPV